ncbi:MAG: hypothetical protein DMG82_08675 [Acidobacteria bacterium]|nr:MAG: hypothetical protein DMG82_08675 [Acidobacteriota bacterium]
MKFVHERFLLAERAGNFKRLVFDGFVAEFNRSPRSITGMLRKPIDPVRTLAADAYSGMDRESLQILSARDFPSQQSVNDLWSILMLCLAGAAPCALGYRQQGAS